jgi:DDE superfamily endonuclease
MDNLKAHKGERVGEMIEAKGSQVIIFLAPYWSPELNPIEEEAFSKIKGIFWEGLVLAREKRWWRQSQKRSLRSGPRMQEVSSETAGTPSSGSISMKNAVDGEFKG